MRRALEYSFYNCDAEEEIECYDLLAKFFHQNQKLAAATYYINKASKSELEPKNSIGRKISLVNIKEMLNFKAVYDPSEELN